MPDFEPPSVQATRIAVSKSKGITIDWADGHRGEYALRYLRDICPCASCSGAHGEPPAAAQPASPFQMYQPALGLVAVEPAGSYALQLTWNDGYNSGIYSYDHLREMCPCRECRPATAAGS